MMVPLLAVMVSEVSLPFLTVLPALDPVAGTRAHQLSRQDCTECSADTDERDAGTGGLIFQMSRGQEEQGGYSTLCRPGQSQKVRLAGQWSFMQTGFV